MKQESTNKEILRIQFIAVGLGVLLLLAKFVAYWLTHSNTILTDALESIINVVAGVFALYSLYLSSKPKDFDHPYGHGKVEFISAGFEGILIALAGVLIIGKSIVAFFNPRTLEHLDIGIAIVVGSGIINYFIGFTLQKMGEKNNSLVLNAGGEHLKSDAYSSFGILAGLVLIIFTGLNYLDNVVAILFGFLIIYTGIKLVRKSIAGIMDEADEQIILPVIKHLSKHRKAQWIDVHNLRIIQYGNKLHVDCHVTLPWYFTLEQAHNEIEEIAAIINEQHSTQVEFFIHEDPCVPTSCKICSIENCPERKETFKEKIEWNLANVIQNKKHGI
ncbi:MAG: cation diffusion facilitator family transporter [Bacteroidetes bacterium]|nr:cation diffusion facilitator family transporter [Bacteroidota bacterium]